MRYHGIRSDPHAVYSPKVPISNQPIFRLAAVAGEKEPHPHFRDALAPSPPNGKKETAVAGRIAEAEHEMGAVTVVVPVPVDIRMPSGIPVPGVP